MGFNKTIHWETLYTGKTIVFISFSLGVAQYEVLTSPVDAVYVTCRLLTKYIIAD